MLAMGERFIQFICFKKSSNGKGQRPHKTKKRKEIGVPNVAFIVIIIEKYVMFNLSDVPHEAKRSKNNFMTIFSPPSGCHASS